MAKPRFEDEWKAAFERAEVTPSESVWMGIELDLEKASGAAAQKKLVYYRWVAAASVLLTVGAGALFFLSDKQQPVNKSSAAQAGSTAPQSLIQPNRESEALKPGRLKSPEIPSKNSARNLQKESGSSKGTVGNGLPAHRVTEAETKQPRKAEFLNARTAGQMPVLYSFKNPELPKRGSVADPGMVLLAKLADEERLLNKKENKTAESEQVWTSFGFGAGSFNPNAGSSAGAGTFNATGNSSAGISYSVGASVGGRLGKRFVLQGGLAYLSQSASYTSSSYSMEATTAVASLDDYIDRQSNLVATSPYEVSSNLQYVTIPLQAGYMIIDRDFAIQLNGGVATDLFIQHRLVPETDQLASVTQKAGEDSPYRSVNFSGIVGTELSYRFGGHYRIAINPGIRYALNSIYKPDISRDITPVTYDISLRCRYIFN
jgi:hypothetical protein